MKILIYYISLTAVVFSFNACAPSYVATEPTYVVVERPPNPGNTHVWIDGDWIYNRRTHTYIHENGHWVTPYRGRTFVNGYWQSTNKGHYWVQGRWH